MAVLVACVSGSGIVMECLAQNNLTRLSATAVKTQVGGLIKRLDTGEGSYAKELEEDYDVSDQLDQV